MRNLSMFSLMIFTFVQLSYANEPLSTECQRSLTELATELVHFEGHMDINTCGGMGTSDNCQLDAYPCSETSSSGDRICNFRYTYGGGYPNYIDYSFTVGQFCEVQHIGIVRM